MTIPISNDCDPKVIRMLVKHLDYQQLVATITQHALSPQGSRVIGPCVRRLVLLGPIQPVENIVLKTVIDLLTSKTRIPDEYLHSLAPFYPLITRKTYVEKKLANFDKWVLRAPEVVIHSLEIVTRYVSFDVSEFFSANFASLLLAQFKSSNVQVRLDAACFIKTLFDKTGDRQTLVGVIKVIIAAFNTKPAASIEIRQQYYSLLQHVSVGPLVSLAIVEALPALIRKEAVANLPLALETYGKHFAKMYAIEQASFDFLLEGIVRAHPGRANYLTSLLVVSKSIASFSKPVKDAIMKILNEHHALGIKVLDPTKSAFALETHTALLLAIKAVNVEMAPILENTKLFGLQYYVKQDQELLAELVAAIMGSDVLLAAVQDTGFFEMLVWLAIRGRFK